MIKYKYFDLYAASIRVLQDYKKMERILNNTPSEIKEIYNTLTTPNASRIDGMPHGKCNVHRHESAICSGLDMIDGMLGQYRQSQLYMAWFNPAWETLNLEERRILSEFFMSECNKEDIVFSLSDEFGIERSAIYERRSRAIHKLSGALYPERIFDVI